MWCSAVQQYRVVPRYVVEDCGGCLGSQLDLRKQSEWPSNSPLSPPIMIRSLHTRSSHALRTLLVRVRMYDSWGTNLTWNTNFVDTHYYYQKVYIHRYVSRCSKDALGLEFLRTPFGFASPARCLLILVGAVAENSFPSGSLVVRWMKSRSAVTGDRFPNDNKWHFLCLEGWRSLLEDSAHHTDPLCDGRARNKAVIFHHRGFRSWPRAMVERTAYGAAYRANLRQLLGESARSSSSLNRPS